MAYCASLSVQMVNNFCISPNGRYITAVMDNGSLNVYSIPALTQQLHKVGSVCFTCMYFIFGCCCCCCCCCFVIIIIIIIVVVDVVVVAVFRLVKVPRLGFLPLCCRSTKKKCYP